MPAKPFEQVHRTQRVRRPFDQPARRNVAEVIGGETGQQRHADVCRRRTMSDRRRGVFLKIIRRQPMIFGADKRLEESPCPARDLMQKHGLLKCELCFSAEHRLADLPRNHRSQHPKHQQRSRSPQCIRPPQCQRHRGDRAQRRRDPHRAIVSDEVAVSFTLGVASGLPFQHPLMREEHPHAGAQDGIQTEERFIGKKDNRQGRLSHAHTNGPGDVPQMRDQRQFDRLAE